ncbi:LysR family transcriptional regulator [Klebsiella sp. 2680]|uniref:LysR family transcriptional regulator n=1 Tax=Klebsiella sp. 2680 TaxID=2018037 RepID=UPI00115BE6FA|nr:LysR family transcriptional regulator [Klebsiella sp. 2680]
MERLDCDRMFVAVMETGSFTLAAQRCGTSHGQASKLISSLERSLGVNLLRRSTRSLTPTDVGLAYYERIRQLLTDYDELNDAVRNIANAPSGRLRISAPVTFGTTQLAPHLVTFAHRYPDIELDVSFSDRLVSVVDEGFDLAIRIGNLSDSALLARRLCPIRNVVVAAPEYLSRRGEPPRWDALNQHDLIVDTNFRDPWHWPFLDRQQLHAQPVSGKLKFSNAEVCLAAARSGLGIARLPYFIARQAIDEGSVIPLLTAYEAPPLALYAVFPPARYLAHKSRVMIDFLAEVFANDEERARC